MKAKHNAERVYTHKIIIKTAAYVNGLIFIVLLKENDMEKMKLIPIGLIIALITKAMIGNINVADAISVVALSALYAFLSKENERAELKKLSAEKDQQIQELRDKMTLLEQNQNTLVKDMSDLKGKMVGVRVAAGFKSGLNG